ncbi:unnamed protein product [Dicrocoelium dendriticum]|nr:unnamed protein product [Dicrocoelium dendriticum]
MRAPPCRKLEPAREYPDEFGRGPPLVVRLSGDRRLDRLREKRPRTDTLAVSTDAGRADPTNPSDERRALRPRRKLDRLKT